MARDQNNQVKEGFIGLVEQAARLAMAVGGGAMLIGVAFLLLAYFSAGQATAEQVAANVDRWGPVALFGGWAFALAAAWMWQEEETAGPIGLILGAALLFAPSWVPMMGGGGTGVGGAALQALAGPGLALVVGGGILFVMDMVSRIRIRAREGMRADKMRYGQSLKEEKDRQNVFLGKCWQLPYCRKFVRERCPIYHSKRTCWQEKVGCMCEESVISNAMKGGVIPKDAVAAAKMIPKNDRLTDRQKQERCNQCVIYNEHLKHKFKVGLPLWGAVVGAFYVLLHAPLVNWMQGLLVGAEKSVADSTMGGVTPGGMSSSGLPFDEIALAAVTIMVFAYGVRALEHAFFRHRS